MLGSPFSAAAALGLNPLAAYGSAGIAGMPGLQGFQLGVYIVFVILDFHLKLSRDLAGTYFRSVLQDFSIYRS